MRRKTRQIHYGSQPVGGDEPVSIQSMCTHPASSVRETTMQIESLARAGCQIVRVAVRDSGDAGALERICEKSPIPVVADIHFDYRLAIESARGGAAGLRINPGNIGSEERVLAVIEAAGAAGIPVRVGVNAGSLESGLRDLYRRDPARALCESASTQLERITRAGFEDIVFSLKSSDPGVTVRANMLFAGKNDYPIHIGLTEAGPQLSGTARSVAALTQLLTSGIGDTVRISLSGDPVAEVIAAAAMLSSLGLRGDIPTIISCPTCGRCHIDVRSLAERIERELSGTSSGIRVAVMGCEVNGPGEAKEADIGMAGTGKGIVIFRKGKIVNTLESVCIEDFLEEIDRIIREK
jgi:(E)-4-hydroxy-3-methylbut-2-enyl-diphosphate synthase